MKKVILTRMGAAWKTAGYVLAEGKGRNVICSSLKNDLQHMAIIIMIIMIYNT